MADGNAKCKSHFRKAWRILMKLNIYLQDDRAIPLLFNLGKLKQHSHKNLCKNIYNSFIHNHQKLETQLSVSECMGKLWYIQTMKY